MSRAQIIILHGHQLSAGHHYAMGLIMQRCNELRHHCDTLSAALKSKHSFLMQTHQLLLCLGQVLKNTLFTFKKTQRRGEIAKHLSALCLQAQTWCDDGAYLLANQLLDKSQSKEGAQMSLREIEKFLEGAPSVLSSGHDILAIEYEAVITPQLQVGYKSLSKKSNQHFLFSPLHLCFLLSPCQTQIGNVFEKHAAVQQMIQNRQASLRKLADKHVRPIQLVAPRPENQPRSKSPLFSPKHGIQIRPGFISKHTETYYKTNLHWQVTRLATCAFDSCNLFDVFLDST